MEHVRGDIGPELAKHVGESVAPQRVSVFLGQLFSGVAGARIVGGGDALSNGTARNLRNVERIISVIFARHENARSGVRAALPEPVLSQRIITLVLMKQGR